MRENGINQQIRQMHCNRDYILTYDQHSLKFKALKDKLSVSSTIDISALPIGAV